MCWQISFSFLLRLFSFFYLLSMSSSFFLSHTHIHTLACIYVITNNSTYTTQTRRHNTRTLVHTHRHMAHTLRRTLLHTLVKPHKRTHATTLALFLNRCQQEVLTRRPFWLCVVSQTRCRCRRQRGMRRSILYILIRASRDRQFTRCARL